MVMLLLRSLGMLGAWANGHGSIFLVPYFRIGHSANKSQPPEPGGWRGGLLCTRPSTLSGGPRYVSSGRVTKHELQF